MAENYTKTEFIYVNWLKTNDQKNIKFASKCYNRKQVHECKTFGVTINQHKLCKSNTENLGKNITSGIAALERLKYFFTGKHFFHGIMLLFPIL